MRFPFSLTRSMTAYLLRKKLSGAQFFPLVLMLEPLHACNLSCTGCGRIREYAATMNKRLSVAQCLTALKECGAPIVSICGGEPLIYPEIAELTAEILRRGKHIYLCTNGLQLENKLEELPRSGRLFINVHLDGMEATHDRLVDRSGVFQAAARGIRAAVAQGRRVCTNTTIYKDTDMHEVAVLFDFLTELGVEGLMIAPAYGYQAVEECAGGGSIFLAREETHEWFRLAEPLLRRFKLTASPIYQEFLRGQRDLTCAAWANPTYNVRGWRGPCYLLADQHYDSWREMIDSVDFDRFGPGNDPRCADCLMHCGFEPAAVLEAQKRLRDVLAMAIWQLG